MLRVIIEQPVSFQKEIFRAYFEFRLKSISLQPLI